MALTGQKIVTSDAGGSISWRDTFQHAIRAAIDVERAEQLQLYGDAATVNAYGTARVPVAGEARVDRAGAALDTLRALTPLQIGGLVIAAALAFALVTGRFS